MVQPLWKLYLRLTNPSCKINAARISRNVKFAKGVSLGHGSVIMADHIGKYTYLNDYCLVDKTVKHIGAFCSIAYNVRIGLGGHPTDWVSTNAFAYKRAYGFVNESKDPISRSQNTNIGNDVWIGANATILAGVTVGDGAIIGAHALVNKDVEPYSIVVGSPARHLRYRFDKEVIDKLKESKWWEWSDDRIRANVHLFSDHQAFLDAGD